MKTNIDEMKDTMVSKVASMTDQQTEELLAAINVIMSGGTDEDARAALVKMRMKHRPNMTKLEQQRLLSGFTRDQLAERSGVPVAVIAGIEDGTAKRAKVEDLLHLAAAMGKIVDELF